MIQNNGLEISKLNTQIYVNLQLLRSDAVILERSIAEPILSLAELKFLSIFWLDKSNPDNHSCSIEYVKL